MTGSDCGLYTGLDLGSPDVAIGKTGRQSWQAVVGANGLFGFLVAVADDG